LKKRKIRFKKITKIALPVNTGEFGYWVVIAKK
jgi:hypothetical protein